MPKVSSVEEILAMELDSIVYIARGKLKQLYKPITSTPPGEWSFQNGELMDASGTIKVTFKDRDLVPLNWKNKEVVIEAHHGDKGWSGAYRKEEEYPKGSGKFKPVLWITKSAEVNLSSEKGEPSAQPQQAASSGTAGAQPAAPSNAAAQPKAKDDAIKSAKLLIGKRLSCLKIATKAVLAFDEEYTAAHGASMPPERIQALIMSLFISADREGTCESLPVNITYPGLEPATKKLPATAAPAPPPKPPPPPPQPCATCGAMVEPGKDHVCASNDDVPF